MPLSREDRRYFMSLGLAIAGPAAAETVRRVARRHWYRSDRRFYQGLADILESATQDPVRAADLLDEFYGVLSKARRSATTDGRRVTVSAGWKRTGQRLRHRVARRLAGGGARRGRRRPGRPPANGRRRRGRRRTRRAAAPISVPA